MLDYAMKFEWDNNKNRTNQEKHGVSFEEAIEVFDDALQISRLDLGCRKNGFLAFF